MKEKPYKAKTLSGAQAAVRLERKKYQFAADLLERFAKERRMLARLAAKGPAFYNPMDAWEAEKIRDDILRRECRMNPDGSPIVVPAEPSSGKGGVK